MTTPTLYRIERDRVIERERSAIGRLIGVVCRSCCHHCEFMCPGGHRVECAWCKR